MKVLVTIQIENTESLKLSMTTFFVNHLWDIETEAWINKLISEIDMHLDNNYTNARYIAIVMLKEIK